MTFSEKPTFEVLIPAQCGGEAVCSAWLRWVSPRDLAQRTVEPSGINKQESNSHHLRYVLRVWRGDVWPPFANGHRKPTAKRRDRSSKTVG
jgi:hypothetical protein